MSTDNIPRDENGLTPNEHWDFMFKMIDDFKKKYLRLPSMRSNDKYEKILANWCYVQKVKMRKNKSLKEHADLLRGIGI
jgi:hypothetical protein